MKAYKLTATPNFQVLGHPILPTRYSYPLSSYIDFKRLHGPIRDDRVIGVSVNNVVTVAYKRIKGDRDYRGLQGVTDGYKGFQGFNLDYRALQLFTRSYRGYRKLQRVTKGKRGLQRVTGRYSWLQKVTGSYRRLEAVSKGKKGDTRGYRGT